MSKLLAMVLGIAVALGTITPSSATCSDPSRTCIQADDSEARKNVYDFFRQLDDSPGSTSTGDERVTARIKSHMAKLLYPVDVSSFVGPDKDVKFRSLIMLLQKQMGASATGVLTYGQFI
jgi:hypothetical protein